jgi:hypothetical protein
MRIFVILFLVTTLIGSCNSKKSNSQNALVETISSSPNNNNTGVELPKGEKIDFDFLTGCDSLERWRGGIQGTQKHSMTCCYMMAQCFANKHYDLIAFNEQDVQRRNSKKTNDQKPTTYFAFEIPKKIPETPENEFDTFDYIFPSDVKVYRKFDDGWYLINSERVETFQELGELKLNTLINLNKNRP